MPNTKELRTFLFIWVGIFAVVALLPLIGGGEIRYWSVAIAMVAGAIAFIKPSIAEGFYKIWIKIGDFIGGIVSKVLLFVLFYFLFTPIAFILKLLGKDLLRKKVDRSQTSYWIERENQPQSMKNQF
jgi:uncharacterized protein involved in cysteine biosynthesis